MLHRVFNKVVEIILWCLCSKIENGRAGLNYYVAFCNLDFIWVKSADKIS